MPPGASLGLFSLTMLVPSSVFGFPLASLWSSLGCFWDTLGRVGHPLDDFGVDMGALWEITGPIWRGFA